MITNELSRTRSALRPLSALALVCASLLGACGGGGGGSAAAPARTDILLTDAPADELLAFGATITGLRLEDSLGGTTANLLAGSVPIEFIGLQQNLAWLASRELPQGTYTAVRLSFAPGSYSARRNDGSEVAVNAVTDDLVASFASPVVVGSSGYRRVVVDLDLLSSLQGSVASPPLSFDPRGSSTDDHGTDPSGIDEVKGVLHSADAASSTFVLDAFVHDDETIPLGPVQVSVFETTLLVRDDGSIFPSASAFFAALVPGSTILEVHGDLANGVIQATRVEFDDNGAGGGSQNLVKMRGLILGIGPTSTFDISIAEVEDGASIVAAAFGGTIPGTLTVTFDGSTVFFLGEHQTTTSDSLAVGEEVQVRFPVFANPPFVASRVEIESEEVGFEGFVTSTAGLPAAFVMHLDHDDPAILSGRVASTSTDVQVDVSSSTFFLDTHGSPPLTAGDILVGAKVEPEGSIAGPPTAPTVTAVRTKVFAGRLRHAIVTGTSPATSTFTTSDGQIDDPFGGGVGPGPLTIAVQPGAIFTGDASSAAAFYALFEGLGAGQSLSVEVRGIGSGSPDRIRAYEIEARING